ncbi:helix-turn-helix domain-containing protein [Rhodococcoides fascians]|uniref:helix-turn-helix domain-containing protein n=1 Tax=Rhodococcoides fascians TaxID=1828 RepID=UPI000561B7F3|nr:helix-turn-helix domain-containing protein [Rhodococcus fascians]
MTEPIHRVLSVAHAAEYLDCSADHVRNLMSDGRIRYLDIGRGRAKIRIPIADLNDYVEKGLRAAPEVNR